jgi:hypothetical protein
MKVIVDWKKLVDVLVPLNAPICVLVLVVFLLKRPYAVELMVICYAVMAVLSIGCIALFFLAALRDTRQQPTQRI